MDCIVCGNPITVEGSNVCGFACLMKTRLGEMPAWDQRRPRKVGKSGGIAGLVSRIDGMRKSPTPVEQEVPMLILKHSRFRGRNVVINATVFSFNMEGVARVKDLGSARDDLEALLRRDAQVTVLHDPRRPAPPTIEVVLAAGYSPEAAEKIVAREQERAAQGLRPYGDNPDPEPAQAAPEPQVAPPAPQEAVPEPQVAQEPTVPQRKLEAPQEAPEVQVEPEVAAPPTEEPVRQPVVKQRRRINKE